MVDEDNAKAIYIVDWLVRKSSQMNDAYDTVSPFRIYSLNKLFYEFRRHADLNNPKLRFSSIALVADHFNKGMFFYSKNMACQVNIHSLLCSRPIELIIGFVLLYSGM